MPPSKKTTYKVVGTQPVDIDGKPYYPGDEVEARPKEVAFLLEVGALKKKD